MGMVGYIWKLIIVPRRIDECSKGVQDATNEWTTFREVARRGSREADSSERRPETSNRA